MINAVLKYWKIIVDVLLVMVLVGLVFWWNPWKIFGGGLKLEDTGNLLTEIHKIGELVTAEYYGEVVSSIEEARLRPIDEGWLMDQADSLYMALDLSIDNLRDFQELPEEVRVQEYQLQSKIPNWRSIIKYKVRKNNISRKLDYLGSMPLMESHPMFTELLILLYNKTFRENNTGLKNGEKEALFLEFYEKDVPQWTVQDGQSLVKQLSNRERETWTKSEAKKKLTMIGRGWVKAGFDFSDLDEESIIWNKERSVIHIMGAYPKILNTDINPWFIPEKGIPGFQILEEKGKVEFKDAQLVKSYCLDKLTLQAHRAALLQNAQAQGELALKNLFSILTNTEIKQVFFHHNPFFDYVKEAQKDEHITYNEAFLLDSLMVMEATLIDSLNRTVKNQSINQSLAKEKALILREILTELRRYPYDMDGESFTMLSLTGSQILKDSLLSEEETLLLSSIRENFSKPGSSKAKAMKRLNSSYAYWYMDSMVFAKEYNDFIRKLSHKKPNIEALNIKYCMLEEDFNMAEIFNLEKVVGYNLLEGEDVVELLIQNATAEAEFWKDLLFPFYSSSPPSENVLVITKEVNPESNNPKANVYWHIHNAQMDTVYHLTSKINEILDPQFLTVLSQEASLLIDQGQWLSTSLSNNPLNPTDTLTSGQGEELVDYMMSVHHEEIAFADRNIFEKASDWLASRSKDKGSQQVVLGPKGVSLKAEGN